MGNSLFRSRIGLGTIYMELDKNKTSIIDITNRIFEAVEGFGFIDEIEVRTKAAGEEAYVEQLNDQGVKAGEPIDQIKVTTKAPTEGFISFVKNNEDIEDVIFSIGTAAYDEQGRKVMIGGVVYIYLYVDDYEEDWALYFKINSDVFVPFGIVRNEQTEEIARKNAPPLKKFIERLIQILPVTRWEWEDAAPYLYDYLEQL